MKNRQASGSMDQPVARKIYYSMGEICKLAQLESHVLRYWESQFKELKPKKNRAGNRVFRHKDVDLIFLIKHLLYERRFTIEGACREIKRLNNDSDQASGKLESRGDRYLLELKKELIELRGILDKTHRDNDS